MSLIQHLDPGMTWEAALPMAHDTYLKLFTSMCWKSRFPGNSESSLLAFSKGEDFSNRRRNSVPLLRG